VTVSLKAALLHLNTVFLSVYVRRKIIVRSMRIAKILIGLLIPLAYSIFTISCFWLLHDELSEQVLKCDGEYDSTVFWSKTRQWCVDIFQE
jgi:hypothetical protein